MNLSGVSLTDRMPVFVYGTLRPGQRNCHYLPAEETRSAVLPGAVLYPGPGFPYCADSPDLTRTVKGELITVAPDVWETTLLALDALEGFDPDRPDRCHYQRVRRCALLPNGSLINCWTYLTANPKHHHGQTPIPDGNWIRQR